MRAGGIRRWRKVLPSGSKGVLHAIRIDLIAEKPGCFGINRSGRMEQPDQSSCGIESDDPNHERGVKLDEPVGFASVCSYFTKIRLGCMGAAMPREG
jgi:hypothetical protein